MRLADWNPDGRVYWLQLDIHPKQFERAGLHRGELRIDHEGGVGRTEHRHGVAGDSGEIAKQRAEAVDGQSVVGALGAGLAIGGLGALGLGDDGVRAASALSSSSNTMGLRAWRMCHST